MLRRHAAQLHHSGPTVHGLSSDVCHFALQSRMLRCSRKLARSAPPCRRNAGAVDEELWSNPAERSARTQPQRRATEGDRRRGTPLTCPHRLCPHPPRIRLLPEAVRGALWQNAGFCGVQWSGEANREAIRRGENQPAYKSPNRSVCIRSNSSKLYTHHDPMTCQTNLSLGDTSAEPERKLAEDTLSWPSAAGTRAWRWAHASAVRETSGKDKKDRTDAAAIAEGKGG